MVGTMRVLCGPRLRFRGLEKPHLEYLVVGMMPLQKPLRVFIRRHPKRTTYLKRSNNSALPTPTRPPTVAKARLPQAGSAMCMRGTTVHKWTMSIMWLLVEPYLSALKPTQTRGKHGHSSLSRVTLLELLPKLRRWSQVTRLLRTLDMLSVSLIIDSQQP